MGFRDAIENSIKMYNKTTKKNNVSPDYSCSVVPSKSTPEMSIVDYMLWALQRYIIKKDNKYFKLLENKFIFIIDLYDSKVKGRRFYNYKNPFDLKKAGEFDK